MLANGGADFIHTHGRRHRETKTVQYFFLLLKLEATNAEMTGALVQKALSLSQGSYGRPNPGRDYLYFRAQTKDALGIVYFSPAITAIVNLQDHSYQLTPELLYTGIRNVELRARLFLLHGPSATDFGEKQVSRKLEVYARWYF